MEWTGNFLSCASRCWIKRATSWSGSRLPAPEEPASRAAIYIDKDGGITVEDCAGVSRMLDPLIEESGIFKSAYVLEVSSPGLDRPLYKPGDYEKFAGSKARVMLKRPLDGKRRNFSGTLRGLDDGICVLLETDDGESFSLPLEDVHRANLVL